MEIEFNELVEEGFYYIKVYNLNGDCVDMDKIEIKKDNYYIMIVKLKKNLFKDVYRVEWNVVFVDGYFVFGVILFSIGKVDGGFSS